MQPTPHQHKVLHLLTTAAFLSYITKVCTVTHVKTERRLLSAAAVSELGKRISQGVEEERATAAVSKAASLRRVSVTLCLCGQGAFTSRGEKEKGRSHDRLRDSWANSSDHNKQCSNRANSVHGRIHFQVWT